MPCPEALSKKRAADKVSCRPTGISHRQNDKPKSFRRTHGMGKEMKVDRKDNPDKEDTENKSEIIFAQKTIYNCIIIYLLRQMAAHIKIYKSIYKKHTIHSIKENYKLGLQFIHCYEKIAVSTKCRHKLRFSSATPEHRLRMEYFDNILPYSCVHIAEKDRITLLSHVRIFFINSNFR